MKRDLRKRPVDSFAHESNRVRARMCECVCRTAMLVMLRARCTRERTSYYV